MATACGQATSTPAPAPSRDGGCTATAPPTDEAAVHDVRFDFTNTSTSTWYVGDAGMWCRTWTLATASGQLVSFGASARVLCEGPPVTPYVVTWTEIPAGATAQKTWDGRSGEVHYSCVDCATRGFPGRTIDEPLTRLVVTNPDDFVATFAVARAIPPTPAPGQLFDVDLQRLCPDVQTATAAFTLSASGTVHVPVDLR